MIPGLRLGDCLAPPLVLTKDDGGVVHAPCPVCGVESTEATTGDGGVPQVHTSGDGVAFIHGDMWLQPCGHRISQIEIDR